MNNNSKNNPFLPYSLGLVFLLFYVVSCTQSPQKSKVGDDKGTTIQAKSNLISETAKGNYPLRLNALVRNKGFRIYGDFLVDENIDIDQVFGRYSVTYSQDKNVNTNTKKEIKTLALHPGNTQVSNGRLVSFYMDAPELAKDIIFSTYHFEIKEKGNATKIFGEIEVKKGSLRTSDKLGVFMNDSEHLISQNFVTQTDSIRLENQIDSITQYTVVRYRHDFPAALPPTAIGYKTQSKALFVDSLFKVPVNQAFVLKTEGIYYIIKDTTDQTGLTIMVNKERYPRYAQAEDLTKPLVYISTNKEYLEMTENKNQKQALDQFWLNLFGNNKQNASKAIKQMYKKVEEANTQFTTYKEGWKTDKGMVYIVMGKPDAVKFLKEKEVWVYTKNAKYSEVNFTFVKKSNRFSDDHYELNRYIEFKPIWLPAVEALRTADKN